MPQPTRRAVLTGAAALSLSACARQQRLAASTPSPAGEPAVSATSPTPAPSPSPSPGRPGPAVEIGAGPGSRPQVALTFHGSGDPALALALLDAAEAGGARITVFAVGTWLTAPGTDRVLARLRDGGHELANHTFTHPALRRLGPAATLAEITRCRDVLEQVNGSPGRFFRPSGTPTATATMLAAAGKAGYRTSLAYDVDPADYRDPGATLVRSRALAAVHPGAVVSLHLGHRGTVEALPGILEGLAQRRLAAVTASTLLPA